MRLHSRTLKVQQANAEIRMTVLKLIEQHELTDIEFLQLLTDMQQSTLKYMLRAERHPNDPDQPAEVEDV